MPGEMLGLCSICGRPAQYTCSLNGELVCALHFDFPSAACINCAAGRKMPPKTM